MTYSDREEELYINKIRKMNAVGGNNIEIANKLISKSIYSTIFQLKLGIQLTQSSFKLIRFNDGNRNQTRNHMRSKDITANVADLSSDISNYL